jgi:hypothetical protein
MGRTCSTNWKKRNIYKLLVGKPEGKRPLERPRHGWLENIKMDLRDRMESWTGMGWNLRVP